MKKVIAVFGSSAPQPGSEAYEIARTVGRLLAEAGFAVSTGGYGGTMAAVSQGAAEAGGHVIGVTSAQIEQFRPTGANQWVAEEVKFETLRDRLLHLVDHNDGIIVLPGSVGTFSELTLAWSFMQVGEIGKRPFALLGDLWRQTIHTFANSEYLRSQDFALLTFVDTPQEAVSHIQKAV